MRKTITAAAVLAGTVALAAPLAAPAQAAPRGTTSIAEVLAADGQRFDRNWSDFDVLERAVVTVLEEDPDSDVKVLTQGRKRLTAFAPTDFAFRRLVTSLTGERPATERATFDAVATLGVETIETVLLYHVVPGAPVSYAAAQKSDGARLEPAAGPHIRVNVRPRTKQVFLRDADRDDRNPRVIRSLSDLNKGNRQIAHGISRVLRPADFGATS